MDYLAILNKEGIVLSYLEWSREKIHLHLWVWLEYENGKEIDNKQEWNFSEHYANIYVYQVL